MDKSALNYSSGGTEASLSLFLFLYLILMAE